MEKSWNAAFFVSNRGVTKQSNWCAPTLWCHLFSIGHLLCIICCRLKSHLGPEMVKTRISGSRNAIFCRKIVIPCATFTQNSHKRLVTRRDALYVVVIEKLISHHLLSTGISDNRMQRHVHKNAENRVRVSMSFFHSPSTIPWNALSCFYYIHTYRKRP